MKPILCLLAGTALLCGCNKHDARIAKYESRISALETNVAELQATQVKLLGLISDLNHQNEHLLNAVDSEQKQLNILSGH